MSDLKQIAMQLAIDIMQNLSNSYEVHGNIYVIRKEDLDSKILELNALLPIEREQNDQQSIEFAEWKDRRFERYANGYKPNAQGKISGFEDRFYTINELLQIFKDKDK